MANRRSQEQWFGCSGCGYVWLGGMLPLNGKQYNAMFNANQYCLLCNATAQFHGSTVPITDKPITFFYGTASELALALKQEAAA